MLLYDIWIQAFCCQLFQMQSTVDERRNWEVCWIEFVSSTFWADEVRWMISKFERGSWSFGATATSLRTARSISRMLDLFFMFHLNFVVDIFEAAISNSMTCMNSTYDSYTYILVFGILLITNFELSWTSSRGAILPFPLAFFSWSLSLPLQKELNCLHNKFAI